MINNVSFDRPTYIPAKPAFIDYQEITVKSVVRVNGNTQCEIVYTYDKHGRLTETNVYKRTSISA